VLEKIVVFTCGGRGGGGRGAVGRVVGGALGGGCRGGHRRVAGGRSGRGPRVVGRAERGKGVVEHVGVAGVPLLQTTATHAAQTGRH